MNDCPICGNPVVQRVTTGEYWCAVYGRHNGPRWTDAAPPAPARPHPAMLSKDGDVWRLVRV